MNNTDVQAVSARCASEGAAVRLSFDESEVVESLKEMLERKAARRGIELQWTEQEEASRVNIRIIEVDQGNQFLRYLIPFVAPAVLEVEGEIGLDGDDPRSFHYVQRAQIGVFGGGARQMIGRCMTRVAHNIAQDIERAVRP
ncbi:MAG: DUF4410 domain-containing protein [Candidatus Krumholzibacteriota bacterium]|nr:DUF4410 domain-containing protein [Candidatus Krumholzibacteriota bacterium]